MDRPDSDAIYHMRRALRGLYGVAPKPIARDLQLRFEAALKLSYQESAEAQLIAEDVIWNMALSGRTLTPKAHEAVVRRCLDLVRAGKPPSPPERRLLATPPPGLRPPAGRTEGPRAWVSACGCKSV